MADPTHEAVTADPRLQLIYEESVRKLEQQAATLESVRGRTGLLLGAGTLSSAFLASVVDCLDAKLLEAFEVVLHRLQDIGRVPLPVGQLTRDA